MYTWNIIAKPVSIQHVIQQYIFITKNNFLFSKEMEYFTPLCREHELAEALHSLISKGYVYFFNETLIEALKQLSNAAHLLHTTRWPRSEEIILSPTGLVILEHLERYWKKKVYVFDEEIETETWFEIQENSDPQEKKCNVIGFTEESVKYGIKMNGGTQLTKISLIGPWSDKWWNIYPYGYNAMMRTKI